jgi:hypothetical protein
MVVERPPLRRSENIIVVRTPVDLRRIENGKTVIARALDFFSCLTIVSIILLMSPSARANIEVRMHTVAGDGRPPQQQQLFGCR